MGVITNLINKPFNPRGNDQSPLAFNKAAIYSGKALDFDGVNDTINVGRPSYMNITNGAITLACYARLDSTAANGHFFRQENGTPRILFAYQAGALDGISFGTYDGSAYSELDIALEPSEKSAITNDVCFVVATQDTNGTRAIYLNGVLIGSDTRAQGVTCTNTGDLHIGSAAGGGEFWDGLIANAKLFDVALTPAQVADLYNFPEKIVPTGVANTALKLWLPMQEGAGTTAYDGSGNGNHGTISGATHTHGIGAPVAQTAVISWNKGENLFPYSNDYSQSNWSTNNATIVADSGTSPDGSNNASLLYTTASGSLSYVYDSLTASSAVYTINAFVKASGRNICWMYIQDASSNGVAYFDLSDQSTQVAAGSSSTYTATITSVGNDWYKISATSSVSFSISSGSGIGISDAKGSLNVTADGTNGILVYGLHIHSGSVGPYIPTFATAQTSPVLLPQGLTTGRDITGVNLFENVRKQGALNLDGKSWAEVHKNDSIPEGDEGRTLECWFFGVDKGATQSYIETGNTSGTGTRFGILTISDDSIYIVGQGYDINTLVAMNLDAWNHVAVTHDGSTLKVYKDGLLIKTGTGRTYVTANADVVLGRNGSTGLEDSFGSIAQPRIYNRALTAGEVLQNYNSGKNTYK